MRSKTVITILTFLCLFQTQIYAASVNVDGIYYKLDASNNTAQVTSSPNNSYSGSISIPSTISYDGVTYNVTSIGRNAFNSCSGLNSVNIANSITFIGGSAFRGCTGLSSVSIPNSVTSIESHTFLNCSNLSKIELPSSISSIPDYFAEGCTSLQSINIPSSISSIGKVAFEGCTSLSSITLPYSITSIGSQAFANCTGLKLVISKIQNPFPIETDVFYGVRGMTLQVPNGTKSLYEQYIGWYFGSITIVEEARSYILSISSFGNGTVTYNGENIRETLKTYTIDEGTNISIVISPDNGYQLKSIKVNNKSVSASSSYSTTINSDTKIEVEFEAIPPKTYSLTVIASGNGSASYGGETIRDGSKSFTMNEGSSAKVSFSPDSGHRIKSVKVNGSSVDAGGSYTVTINTDTKVEVVFEAIPVTTYSLTIKATGNGSASYSGETIRGGSKAFTVNEGTSATVSFNPDSGYRVKSIKVNDSSVDAGSSYTITVNSNTTLEVEFEAIPATTYTLTIKATGNGSASYNGETIRGGSKSFTVNEGTSATVSFNPDSGYRVKSIKVNDSSVDAGSSYTVTVNSNTTVEVEFETIPVTTYTLTIKATGNGSASYSGETIRGGSKSFTVNEGTRASVSFTPDNGYRVKNVKVNNSSVDAGSSYTVTVNSNTTLEVEFEAIPATTYTLTIKATGNGSASYSGETIRGGSKSFTVNEGTRASVSFTPDNGYRVKNVKVNNSSVDAGSSYTVTVNSNTTLEVEFEAIPATTYTLTIKATGNGSASYNGETIRGGSKSYTVNEGTRASVSFTPDNGYRVKNVKVNNSSVDAGSSYTVTVNSNTTLEVEFEAIPITTFTLTISASGNGSASYGGETIRGGSKSYTVNEGTQASISFSPDNGYQIKTVKVNGSTVSAGSSYTVTVNSNTTVSVEFEAKPDDPTPTPPTPTTYTLSISASGNGTASYNGSSIRGTTSSFTVNEGTSATISFSPDNGYQIKTVKVNGSAVSVGSSYTVTVNSNTTVTVEFEAIPVDPTPTQTDYILTISAKGNGYVSFSDDMWRNRSSSMTVTAGRGVYISVVPDDGYRIKTVTVNGSSVEVNSHNEIVFTVNSNTTVIVEFEAIPVTTYTLTVIARGNGEANYNGSTVRNGSRNFSVGEGSSPRVSFIPDEYNFTKSVKLNGSDVSVSDNRYTINDISGDNTLEVEFEMMVSKFSTEGVNYQVSSYENRTVVVSTGDYGLYLEVPEKVVDQGYEWTVAGISNEAINDNKDLAAIIWNPSTTINIRTSNPNFLLYVKDSRYAPSNINNVVINDVAESITLSDAQSGNNFYCPRGFTAKKITYSHRYRMRTGGGESKGWETIALPFDVQKIEHADEGEIFPFANWSIGSNGKPFWLYQMNVSGFVVADGIKANTPYIISMPNNDVYQNDYILRGTVNFSASNAEVKVSDNIVRSSFGNRTFVPNFINIEKGNGYYSLNVNNDIEAYQGAEKEGSVFIQDLRRIHPFEAYMNSTAGTRSIGVFDDMTTAIKGIDEIEKNKTLKVYNLNGQCIKTATSMDELRKELPAGLYIINNKKVIIK